jgi:hypothetical protein
MVPASGGLQKLQSITPFLLVLLVFQHAAFPIAMFIFPKPKLKCKWGVPVAV